jgi:hypothetical protein
MKQFNTHGSTPFAQRQTGFDWVAGNAMEEPLISGRKRGQTPGEPGGCKKRPVGGRRSGESGWIVLSLKPTILTALSLLFISCSTLQRPIEKPIIVTLKTIEVHIVPDFTHFPANAARLEVLGCAVSDGRIYMIGRQTDRGVIFDHSVAGHELAHLLNWKDGRIQNPDMR